MTGGKPGRERLPYVFTCMPQPYAECEVEQPNKGRNVDDVLFESLGYYGYYCKIYCQSDNKREFTPSFNLLSISFISGGNVRYANMIELMNQAGMLFEKYTVFSGHQLCSSNKSEINAGYLF